MTSPRRFSFPQSQVWSGKLGFGMRPKIANLIDKSTGDKRPRAFIVSFGKSCARWHQDAQLPQDDETRRLIAAREACRAKELAAADQLSKPRHSMLYSAYTRLLDALGAVRLRCDEITLATEERRPGVLEERWKHAGSTPEYSHIFAVQPTKSRSPSFFGSAVSPRQDSPKISRYIRM
jgi:hypothetical protein